MSGIQPTRDRPDMAAPCACTNDGNTMIPMPQDESYTLDATWEGTAVRGAEGMWEENTSSDQGVYKFQVFG